MCSECSQQIKRLSFRILEFLGTANVGRLFGMQNKVPLAIDPLENYLAFYIIYIFLIIFDTRYDRML